MWPWSSAFWAFSVSYVIARTNCDCNRAPVGGCRWNLFASKSLAKIARGIVESSKVSVLPNGADFERFPVHDIAAIAPDLGIAPETTVIPPAVATPNERRSRRKLRPSWAWGARRCCSCSSATMATVGGGGGLLERSKSPCRSSLIA